MCNGTAVGSASDDKDGNGGRHKHEEEEVVAPGKGVRARAHPMVGSTQRAEKRLAWRRSSGRWRVWWSPASGGGPCSTEEG
jgi:hypothetical protein